MCFRARPRDDVCMPHLIRVEVPVSSPSEKAITYSMEGMKGSSALIPRTPFITGEQHDSGDSGLQRVPWESMQAAEDL